MSENEFDNISNNQREVIVAEPEQKEQTREPSKYVVILHNDDYTPMDFVVDLLVTVFGHTLASATTTMLDVHKNGQSVAGIYTRDVAETKATVAQNKALAAQHPLMVSF